MKIGASLKQINYYISIAVVFLIPLFFLPITSEFYEFNKQALLIVAALVSFLIWSISFITERQVRVVRSPLGLPILGIILAWTVSVFLKTPNRFDGLFEPGQVGTMAALGILFFTSINAIHTKKQVETLVTSAMISMFGLSILTIGWSSGVLAKLIPVTYMQSPIWSPTGNAVTTVAILVMFAVFSILLIVKGKSQFKGTKTTAISILIASLIISAGLLSYQLFFATDSTRPVFLSQATSWAIALEAIKTSPILGTGPATYLADFTQFRPISYNMTPTWAVRFASSSNYYLQLLSTVGILGLGAYVILVLRTVKLFSKSFRTTSESSLHSVGIAASTTALLGFIGQLFIPTSLTYTAVIFFLLIIATLAFKLLGSSLVHEANIDIVAASDSGNKSPILPWLSLIAAIALLIPTSYFAGKLYIAETLFQSSLVQASKNDGKSTYDTLIKAISMFPYRDSYRIAYSNVNLLLANSIASGKKELTAEEKNTITQLIQQSIREAKNAVALNPNKVTNVENLAGVYRQLLTLAKGADAWTVAAYQRAIQLDPANPNIRIALGGVVYSLKNYDEAIRIFQSAADLKPDLANAYYNMAAAYKEKGDYVRAYNNMQAVVANVKKDSADYTKALAELEELKTKAGDKSATQNQQPAKSDLSKPEPLPTPKAQIELPNDLGPDTSGTPTPSVAPTRAPGTSVSPTPAQ